MSSNTKTALAALRASKWRSLFTMLGIIIGIVSVVITVSLGEGAKQRIVGQINQAGPDLITIKPGRSTARTAEGRLHGAGLLANVQTGALSEEDYTVVRETSGVGQAVPLGYLNGIVRTSEREYPEGVILGTTPELPAVLHRKVEYGVFFSEDDAQKDVAVIGKDVATQLFQERVPVGKSFMIRDRQFVVRGVLEETEASPLIPQSDYNTAILIPYEVAKELQNGQAPIFQILSRPEDPKTTAATVQAITKSLKQAHAGQADFTVLRQEDALAVATYVLNVLTGFIAAIAAISLLVGGIGILNIMFVSVTERTHEIGVRKAVGATNRQILGQFLTEAVVLSFVGGLIGILLSVLVNYLLRIFTTLTPVLTWPIMVIAAGISISVGIIFGITPALKAARKHPIDALRHE